MLRITTQQELDNLKHGDLIMVDWGAKIGKFIGYISIKDNYSGPGDPTRAIYVLAGYDTTPIEEAISFGGQTNGACWRIGLKDNVYIM